MDLVQALSAIPGLGPYAPTILAIAGLCSLVCMALPAPGPGSSPIWLVVYTVVNKIGGNAFNAKNADDVAANPGYVQNKPPKDYGLAFAVLGACAALLSACTPAGTLTPQATGVLNGFCIMDGKLQPVAVTIASTVAPAAAPAIAIDNALVHPAIIAGCAALGGLAAPSAAQPPAALVKPAGT